MNGHDLRRRWLLAAAAFGLLWSALRLLTITGPAQPTWPVAAVHQLVAGVFAAAERPADHSPRGELADQMEVFEVTVRYGSPLSANAFSAIATDCRSDDAVIDQACGLFNDAVQHEANLGEIDAAVRLLRGG